MNVQDKIGNLVGRFIKARIGDILESLMKTILTAAAFIAVFVAIGFFMSWPVMKLWNGCLVPAVTGLSLITWKQAWGINVLMSILFKSSTSNSTSSKEK